MIEYEIKRGRDFWKAKKIRCDLAMCNPPWMEADQWLRHLVKVVGQHTPIVFICPLSIIVNHRNCVARKFLEEAGAPRLDHITPLPGDTFVGVFQPAAILWLNLPDVRNVALVPSQYLVRSNNPGAAGSGSAFQSQSVQPNSPQRVSSSKRL